MQCESFSFLNNNPGSGWQRFFPVLDNSLPGSAMDFHAPFGLAGFDNKTSLSDHGIRLFFRRTITRPYPEKKKDIFEYPYSETCPDNPGRPWRIIHQQINTEKRQERSRYLHRNVTQRGMFVRFFPLHRPG